MDINNVKKAADLIERGHRLLDNGPLSYYLTQLIGSYEYMMERFCPFRVGDRVILVNRPDLHKNPGWMHYQHFLTVGAKATVRQASCTDKGFIFHLEFDEESWIDDHGSQGRSKGTLVPVPEHKRHQFRFSEDFLAKELPA